MLSDLVYCSDRVQLLLTDSPVFTLLEMCLNGYFHNFKEQFDKSNWKLW